MPFSLPSRHATSGLNLALALAMTLAMALCAPAVHGADTTPTDRRSALAAIAAPDPALRLQGIASLAGTGGMAEAPLLTGLLRDPDRDVRAAAEQGLWMVWGHSGDAAIDRLYRQGVALMGESRYAPAMETFNRIIRDRPQFAEGWNKRATLYFLLGDYARSLRDCAEVIKRNPDHFGALSGYGQIYVALEQYELALDYFRKALAVNPNMAGVEKSIEQIEGYLRERNKNMI
jgi:tetratricopeptide (TPR) repeat protein